MFDEIYYLLFFSKTIKFIESQLSGARAYLCGHDHGYAHARIDDGDTDYSNDVHQFVVGTAGAGVNIKPNYNYDGFNTPYQPVLHEHAAKYGYMLIEIDGAKATSEFKALNEKTYEFESSQVFSYFSK